MSYRSLLCLMTLVWMSGVSAQVDAQETKPVELVVNLVNPSGVAVHGPTGHVFTSSRWGIYRYNSRKKDNDRVHLEITGNPKDVYGKGPKFDIGPLGLAFLDDDHLIVGGGGRPDGQELVRIYKVAAEEQDHEAFAEDSAAITLGPIAASELTAKGEGNFYGVAVGAGAIFVTCNGDDTKGWIAKAVVTDGKPGELTPSIATKVATGVDAPVPLAFSADGKELVVGQSGEVNIPGDSLLTFYDPENGQLSKSLKTGLHDVTGLAYSPKTKKLYAVDFAWVDNSQGGLFELEIGEDEVTPKKIVSLDKPTALAFDSDGTLYITVFGTAQEGDEFSSGKLLRIDPGL